MEVNGSASPMDVDTPEKTAYPTKEEVPKDGTTARSADNDKVDGSRPSVADSPAPNTSDSDDDLPGEEETAAKTSSNSPEEKLVKAVTYKDKGNACITTDSASALKHYERGIKIASTLSTDDQAKALLVSLRLNLSLACVKEERYFEAASAATKVLEVDPTNTKALYRRGVARARLGLLEDAKSDLATVRKLDPRNSAAKKELTEVGKQLDKFKKKEKARYGGLFDKGPMYNDKEVERQKREAEAAKLQKQEEMEWRRVNLLRKAKGKEEQSLEDWRKEKKKEEEAKKKREEEEKKKQKPSPPVNAARPPKAPSKKGEETEGDKVHDEEDMKIIKDALGYCYFNRKLSEKEQSLLDEEQKKLRARVSPPVTKGKSLEAASATEGAGRSAWNEAGTWEEVNKTEWCKGKLIAAFSKVTVTVGKDPANDPEFLLEKLGNVDFSSIGGDAAGGKGLQALAELRYSLSKMQASVTNVEIPGGEAHIICVSNKIKHIFEFNVKLKFSLTIDESMGLPSKSEGGQGSKDSSTLVKRYSGKLEFPDMTNIDVENGRFDSEPELKWDKGTKWDSMYDDRVKSCITELKASTFSALGNFFAEFKSS